MDSWESENDVLEDLLAMNELGDEVNQNYWLKDDSSSEGPSPPPPPSKPASEILPINVPLNSTAAQQQILHHNIISDMTKANITFEPDYEEIFRKKMVSISAKEPDGFLKKKKGKRQFRPISSGECDAHTEKHKDDEWKPVEFSPFTVREEEFPQLKK